MSWYDPATWWPESPTDDLRVAPPSGAATRIPHEDMRTPRVEQRWHQHKGIRTAAFWLVVLVVAWGHGGAGMLGAIALIGWRYRAKLRAMFTPDRDAEAALIARANARVESDKTRERREAGGQLAVLTLYIVVAFLSVIGWPALIVFVPMWVLALIGYIAGVPTLPTK